MNHHFHKKLNKCLLVAGGVAVCCSLSFAQETVVSLALRPIQTAFVKGDVSKFRAVNWTKDGAQSGVKDFLLDAKPSKDVQVSFEGSGMAGDTDYAGTMLVTKQNTGYIRLDYDSFRKYYENKGGYFPFPTSGYNLHTLNQDLMMDIGHLLVEVGNGTPDDSNFSLTYERGTKKGTKDSTTWGYVKDYAFSANTTINRKKIAPVFYDKDETTDTLTAKEKGSVAGFTLKGEQKYSFFDSKNTRQEQIYGSTGVASENKITRQTETPQTKELSSVVRAERWTLNDKTYFSMGYRFGHLRNSMLYAARDYTSVGNFTPAGFLSGGTFRNGDAESVEDSHTWTGMMLSNITDNVTFVSRLKGEVKDIHGTSDFYTLNASEVAQSEVYQVNENKISNTAESLSLRYSGLARTSLYADVAFSQERNWRSLQTLPSTYAETINHVPEASETIGMRVSPVNKVSLTTEFKHSDKTDKLDQITGSDAPYINKMDTVSDDASVRLAWKPLKWFENSFKVKAGTDVYRIQALRLDSAKMPGSERNFIYDVTLLPTDQLMFNLSYSLDLFKVESVGVQNVVTPPCSTANVYSWTFGTSYAPTATFSFFNSLEYSRAKNQSGFSASTSTATETPMIFSTDAEWYNIDNGVKWTPKKDIVIEPHYAYYAYRSFDNTDTGNYSAHVVWLDLTKKW